MYTTNPVMQLNTAYLVLAKAMTDIFSSVYDIGQKR